MYLHLIPLSHMTGFYSSLKENHSVNFLKWRRKACIGRFLPVLCDIATPYPMCVLLFQLSPWQLDYSCSWHISLNTATQVICLGHTSLDGPVLDSTSSPLFSIRCSQIHSGVATCTKKFDWLSWDQRSDSERTFVPCNL